MSIQDHWPWMQNSFMASDVEKTIDRMPWLDERDAVQLANSMMILAFDAFIAGCSHQAKLCRDEVKE